MALGSSAPKTRMETIPCPLMLPISLPTELKLMLRINFKWLSQLSN